MSVPPLTRDLLWLSLTLVMFTAGAKGTKVDLGIPLQRMSVHPKWLTLLEGRISKWYLVDVLQPYILYIHVCYLSQYPLVNYYMYALIHQDMPHTSIKHCLDSNISETSHKFL